ncbi:uroporphyrinogen-III synthase [Planktotalea sp.]|uniref:uroporphyrinogen-III synthase n=1 Tax=Planktotalea sp. TaxID=2029877 RepID=UPI003297AE6F
MAQSSTLLLTRPQAASDLFARQVQQALGALDIVISPLLEIEFLKFDAPKFPVTLIFTSRNGVEAWSRAKLPTDERCICVGKATGQAAQTIGFDPIVSGGTVEHLREDIIKNPPQGDLVHIRGRHTRGHLVDSLRESGVNAQELITYDQKLLDLNDEALRLLQGGAPVIVPLFSPRSAAQFAKAGPFGLQVDVIAISKAAADLCPGARIAPSPDAKGMIAAISQGPMP